MAPVPPQIKDTWQGHSGLLLVRFLCCGRGSACLGQKGGGSWLVHGPLEGLVLVLPHTAQPHTTGGGSSHPFPPACAPPPPPAVAPAQLATYACLPACLVLCTTSLLLHQLVPWSPSLEVVALLRPVLLVLPLGRRLGATAALLEPRCTHTDQPASQQAPRGSVRPASRQ